MLFPSRKPMYVTGIRKQDIYCKRTWTTCELAPVLWRRETWTRLLREMWNKHMPKGQRTCTKAFKVEAVRGVEDQLQEYQPSGTRAGHWRQYAASLVPTSGGAG